jgi:filamentous hemagglutinin
MLGFTAILATDGLLDGASVWDLGPGPRGLAIETQLGGNLPAGFPVIDVFDNGAATSIKSINLNASTYQNTQALNSRLNGYIDSLANWQGQTTPYSNVLINPGDVTSKTLQIAVPQGSMSAAQQAVFNAAAQRAQSAGINLTVTPVP